MSTEQKFIHKLRPMHHHRLFVIIISIFIVIGIINIDVMAEERYAERILRLEHLR